ncbi:hypothetical protein Lal_00017389 [Lupinus albus]|uniref:Putative WW domain-containing protein n=1 Tax=Lupinus albus TaxID=3870 RepID=A0A6A4QNI9_LUPAL|nr:putative WW domain-containing protein [Lupinus albus]KAF1869812.1 hypothetical protein Lal_00017389 [Lupinus albus]
MEAITASLERSLQNCSLNNNPRKEEEEGSADAHGAASIGISSSSDDVVFENHNISHSSDTTLELNSHLSLPYHWEQCLDLKTGEIYYINWKNGIKAKEDPRSMMSNKDYEEESEEEEESWYDSEESSSESCCPSSSSNNKEYNQHHHQNNDNNNNNVLVVAGCKSCLMYFMVPKQVEECPKCIGQLLHFDRPLNNNATSPSPSPSF